MTHISMSPHCALVLLLSPFIVLGCVPEVEAGEEFGDETQAETSETGDGDGDGDMTTTGDGDGDMTTTGDGDGDMTTTGDGDGDPVGLPEGQSTWSGSISINGFDFLLSAEIDNQGGDLDAVVEIADDPELPLGIGSATYELSGASESFGGTLTLAPYAWVEEGNIGIELQGVVGTYDPDTMTLSGEVIDYVTAVRDAQDNGTFTLTLEGGDGPPAPIGDQAASLAIGTNMFVGTHQCSGPEREAVANLDYDGLGKISGEVEIGDPGLDNSLGAFEVTGTHNPTTGAITLAPGLWVAGDQNILNFFVDGTFDPQSGAFNGNGLTNSAACIAEGWNTMLQ